jgi:hypothetical protein
MMSPESRQNARRRAAGLVLLAAAAMVPTAEPARGGAFIFAGTANGVDLVCHPAGYSGTQRAINVVVCINPASPNAAAMEISVQNVVAVLNQRLVTSPNLFFGGATNIPASHIDFESTALHEVGHCVGLAHPNLATESGLPTADQDYTKSTQGPNGVFNVNAGVDGIKGSFDDQRSDDVNLHWFRRSNNNPLTIPAVVDSTTYARATASLPAGHSFAANADRTVAGALGFPNTEAVMNQGAFFVEAQRTLAADDVATLRYAMAGLDRLQGTADDYKLHLTYGGLTTSGCNIVLAFDNAQTGFAVCQVAGLLIGGSGHARITTASSFFNTGFNWFFNNVRVPFIFADGFEMGSAVRWSSAVP